MKTEELKARYLYDPSTGTFTRKVSGLSGSALKTGCKKRDGYTYIKILGKAYLAHRLAWLYVYGEMPSNHIDHVNGDRSDNRIENLREANASENSQNLKSARKDNKAGLLGVSFNKQKGKYVAQICLKGKTKFLGYFKCPVEAHRHYLTIKKMIHPFFTE